MDKLLAPFLWVLSLAYGFVTWFRNVLYDCRLLPVYKSSLKVISVGNISVGGTGKTPLCIYLAEKLKEKGARPVILSRGYGGRLCGPHLVSENDDYRDVGDEPLLMVKTANVPVVIAKKRVLGAKFIEEKKLGDTIILDDGFQHRALARDVDIVTVNYSGEKAVSDFQKGLLLPFGRFREYKEKALRRANIVVFSERGPSTETFLPRLSSHLKVFRSHSSPEGIFPLCAGTAFSQKRAFVFCGIANPEGFISTLINMGIEFAGQKFFPDHFQFGKEELNALRNAGGGSPLVCTEKDAIKIPPESGRGVYVLKAKLILVPDSLTESL